MAVVHGHGSAADHRDERSPEAVLVMPGRMREARRKARRGLVVLTGAHGIQTMAEHLLAETCTPGSTPIQLPDRFDVQGWFPDHDGSYLLRETTARLLEFPASLSSLAARLREAQATLVIVVPSGVRLTDRATTAAADYLVQCLSPDSRQVFSMRIETGANDPRALPSSLPDGFLAHFLPPWSSPQDAVDVAEALILHESPTGLTRKEAHNVRAHLDHQADLEISEFLRHVKDLDVMDVLLSAATFRGRPLRIVLEEAERLASLYEVSGDRCFDGARALTVAAQLEGIRVEPAHHRRSRIVFSRAGWADALLRYAWCSRPAMLLPRWLAGVPESTLVEQAGWALALSVPMRSRPLRLSEVQGCALRKEPLAIQVAAAALRALMNGSSHSDEAAKIIAGWTCGDSEHLHHLAALTCGSGSATAPFRPALTIIRRLARRLETDYHPLTDGAAREALLAHFRSGDRRMFLSELVAWTSHGEAEAVYATRLFSDLLKVDLRWFHDCVRPRSEWASTVVLIQRTIRLHGPSGRLLDALTIWQRLASRHPADTESFGDLLKAVSADGNPQIRRFLRDLHRRS
ncbi:hypothetical protein [Actinomadura fibrosa]|uniref:Uncharacterized protein n=1 Tax=Actinomadura fibrosa TaxID=111802 RepID=A0ABW2XFP8_9ACTN|nr:hypothetical protein [Actinomadura fibrosa]